MRTGILLATLLLAGCAAPVPSVPGRVLSVQEVGQAEPVRILSHVLLAEGEAPEQATATVTRYRSQNALNAAWNAIPFYSKDKSLCPNKLGRLDFGEQSVYLIGIPYQRWTDDPVIDTVEEQGDAIVIRYHTTERGEVELPVTKTHYLAVAFKASDKPVRLLQTDDSMTGE